MFHNIFAFIWVTGFSILPNGYVYETFGISGSKPVKPLQFLLNVTTLKLAPSAKCFIYFVTSWPLFIFNQLVINFVVHRAFGQTHSLTSFGRAVGFSSDLAMCVVVKRWNYLIAYFLSLCLNASSPPSNISQTCSRIPFDLSTNAIFLSSGFENSNAPETY